MKTRGTSLLMFALVAVLSPAHAETQPSGKPLRLAAGTKAGDRKHP